MSRQASDTNHCIPEGKVGGDGWETHKQSAPYDRGAYTSTQWVDVLARRHRGGASRAVGGERALQRTCGAPASLARRSEAAPDHGRAELSQCNKGVRRRRGGESNSSVAVAAAVLIRQPLEPCRSRTCTYCRNSYVLSVCGGGGRRRFPCHLSALARSLARSLALL